jgi:RNA polymerase sigma-70 factor (ECF subfamily)
VPAVPPAADDAHLSALSTCWTVLHDAHGTDPGRARAAQHVLVERYRPAIQRYLRAVVRDPHHADDLFQEFAVRLVRGDFRTVTPDRGRFRSYLKTVLYHLIVDWHRRKPRAPTGNGSDLDAVPAAGEASIAGADGDFLAAWRQDLFDQAWAGLRALEQRGGKPLFAVLRLRTDRPELRSHELAELLAARLGRPLSAGLVRKYLLEARERLADGLVAAVAESVAAPTPDAVADELQEVGLLDYCRDALARWGDR